MIPQTNIDIHRDEERSTRSSRSSSQTRSRTQLGPHRTLPLLETPLFKERSYFYSDDERRALSYERAKAIGQHYEFTPTDVLHCTRKFWDLHQDGYICLDGGAITLLTIQYNLFSGTIAKFAMKDRPDLLPILNRALRFEVSGQFLLTEMGRGLDIANMQTRAEIIDGEIDLHTPEPSAAKFMPPTPPAAGIPRVAVVFAKLYAHGEDRGVRPFLVALSDGQTMCKGVTSQVLPARGGPHPVDHSITSFNHVRLPMSALLGPTSNVPDPRAQFFSAIWRVSCGTLALSGLAVPYLKNSAYIAGTYSMRRKVSSPNGGMQPIISFRTQHTPILFALAQAFVFEAFWAEAQEMFLDETIDPRVRHGIAAASKAIAVQHSQMAHMQLSERCGAQGLFGHNQLVEQQSTMRGVAIAEGDILGLSIRLVSELLQGRYKMPQPRLQDSWISRHETSIFSEKKAALLMIQGGHRSPAFNRLMVPACQPMTEAMGHRFAYEAAVARGVDRRLIALYEASVIRLDPAWYAENGLPRQSQVELEDAAITAALPHLEHYLAMTNIKPYSVAPISGAEGRWDDFVSELPIFSGDATVDLGLDNHPKRPPVQAMPIPHFQVKARL